MKTKYLLQHIDTILKCIPKKADFIMAGDLNIDFSKCTENVEIKNFFDKLINKNILQLINVPTRITQTTATIIDHLYIRTKSNVKIKKGTFLYNISDHLCNFLILNKNVHNKYRCRKLIRIMNEKAIDSFKNCVNEIHVKISNEKHRNSNNLWQTFEKELKDAFNVSFLLRRLSRKKCKDKVWITSGIKKSANMKERLYKKWMKNKSDQNEMIYKTYKNVYNKTIRLAKESYYCCNLPLVTLSRLIVY